MTRKSARRRTPKIRTIARERRSLVRREEFNDLIGLLNERGETINALVRNQEIQFQRIAQLQAEVDLLKRRVEEKVKRAYRLVQGRPLKLNPHRHTDL